MILPTEKSAWGILLAGSRLKWKSGSAEGPVNNQTGAFVDAVNALCLSGNSCVPKINTDFPQADIVPAKDAFKGTQNVLSDENTLKDSFDGITGKVNISGKNPFVDQDGDLINVEKKNELWTNGRDKKNGIQEKESQNYYTDQNNAPQSIQYGFTYKGVEKSEEIQDSAFDGNREEIQTADVKKSILLKKASANSFPNGLSKSIPEQLPAGLQLSSEMDKLQVRAEIPGMTKENRYETSASKESWATQSLTGSSESMDQRTVKTAKLLSTSDVGFDPREHLEKPDQLPAGIQQRGEMDKPQVKAENAVIQKNVWRQTVTSAGISKESEAIQNPAGGGEEINKTTVKAAELLSALDTGFKTREQTEKQKQNTAGLQLPSEMDKPQSIVGDFVDNAGYIEEVQTDTWVPSFLKNIEISTNFTPGKGRVVQLFAASKNSGKISDAGNVKNPDGDERMSGMQKQSDLLQNIAGFLPEATGIPGNTAFKQESSDTYRQVSIAELPSVMLSAIRSSGSREKLIRINLVPENLGPLTIKVKEIKNKLVIHFIASSADAKEILEVSMPQLKQSISQLPGSMDETLFFLSQEQGQGKDNHTQGGWNHYNNSLTRLLNDPVGDTQQQTFENGINSQGEARAVNYWV
ncbi:MAG: Flagellar hook-length control protein-like protein [Desulfotomaculum sp. 46_296]|nr:MAG: Flagellar hook-length control protein-like protein [Desulfotomaculum sp. 46_296]HAU32311.1 hypothetical protein [Desulfotomaculum sp.]